MEQQLHAKPFRLRNNRKMNKARVKMLARVQSIPVYEMIKDHGVPVRGEFKGYKYIVHGKN